MLVGKKKSLIKRAWKRRVKPTTGTSSSSSSFPPTSSPRCPPPPSCSSPTPPPTACHPLLSQSRQFAQQQHHQYNLPASQSRGTNILLQSPHSSPFGSHISGNQSALKTSALTILNQLKVAQLESLVVALETGYTGPCVQVHKEDITVGGLHRVSPAYLSLVVWRWPDLPFDTVLKSIPPCAPDPGYTCINPYHSAVYCFTPTDSPPPPYRERPPPPDRLRPPDDEDSLPVKYCQSSRYESQETDGRTQTSGWCTIRYWERSTRVGRMYEVLGDSVRVVGVDSPLLVDTALCLNLLSSDTKSSEETIKIRNKMGLGILICREDSKVYLYNKSNIDVFVSSATLPSPINDYSRLEKTVVQKVQHGQVLEIFNFNEAQHLVSGSARTRRDGGGPIDVFHVHVSFCKGWGENYKRRDITGCPCWLELHLEPPR